jgi:hypothetical protein
MEFGIKIYFGDKQYSGFFQSKNKRRMEKTRQPFIIALLVPSMIFFGGIRTRAEPFNHDDPLHSPIPKFSPCCLFSFSCTLTFSFSARYTRLCVGTSRVHSQTLESSRQKGNKYGFSRGEIVQPFQ